MPLLHKRIVSLTKLFDISQDLEHSTDNLDVAFETALSGMGNECRLYCCHCVDEYAKTVAHGETMLKSLSNSIKPQDNADIIRKFVTTAKSMRRMFVMASFS